MATGNNNTVGPLVDSYDEEDDTATTASTGATLSTMMDQDFCMDSSQPLCLQDDMARPTSRSALIAAFETSMLEKTRTIAASSPSRNTYFLDGGNRFISVRRISEHIHKIY